MKRIIYILLSCIGLGACSDFLEPKSDYEFIPETVEALNEILLGDAYLWTGTEGLNVADVLQVLDDDVECSDWDDYGSDYNMQSAMLYSNIFCWQPNMFKAFYEEEKSVSSYNIYRNYYTKILGVNAVLDMIDKVDGGEDERCDVRAQAYALRALYYFNLVNIYGKPYNFDKKALGVPLKLTSALEEKAMARNTVEECYNQILADLEEAEKNYQMLPENMQFKRNYRTNLPMVQLLLARVHLYMENWQQAYEYAEKVIRDWDLRLMDFNNLPAYASTSIPYLTFTSFTVNPEVIYAYGSAFQNFSGLANVTRGDWMTGERDVFVVSRALIECYEETPGDLRKKEYLVQDDEFPVYYRIFSKCGVQYPRTVAQDEFSRAFRLAEAYLIQAESAAELYKAGKGGADAALEPLNTLRRTRFATYKNVEMSNAEELIEFIRRERRREMCFEDHRWFDLRRWGMPRLEHKWHVDAQTTLTYVLEEKDPGYTLPLPEEELVLNRDLIQNELRERKLK